ncbi:Peroxyureidoacrylate/ureidoacrylate amidohydrolase RutB [Thalassovita gelatinovora]|uniref:Peroxyureidoacrylate/ureidoacrylate amidohydrolase RutB n=1 Tax=Thalassovita gelatinovora TaxID=53501 RepID=A0A0P1F3N3_THAGE|nr:isochorismatase family cysteine hydrolase [Thalassovita gelatinovora]QIZ81789.1 cysteine hydrolase [Thalassovita gelatinovora]CUH62319.1 Peroxyureidoacrylate/ureidoacrylate amidohydrolase RutB [Thalassovita gelatinovora]SER15550.1 ureidoacrylate peracid hydrolase [Thalassovita gelatinovora]
MTTKEPHILSDFSERFAPAHTALLIIDMQNDFCLDGFATSRAGRPLDAAQAIIPTLETLLRAARQAGVLVCHVGFWTLDHHLSDTAPWLAQRRRATYASDRIAMAGSEGADFIEPLSPQPDEPVIRKHRYSAFKGTDLDMVLRARGIKSVVPTGVSTNVCVESTLRDAFETGHYTALPRDACASWDLALHDATLKTANARFGLVCDSADLIQVWTGETQ